MASEKRVLLARPHAFIVTEMRLFLIEAGYVPVRVEDLAQLGSELGASLQGAVISTAVTSTMDADAATVFRVIRQAQPGLPVVFAGMADFDTMKAVTQRAVSALVPSPTVAGPRDFRAAGGAAKASNFLVLRKPDLQAGAAHDASIRALRASFG